MNDQYKITISKKNYNKLKKISETLKTSISELTELAFKEFFELIKNDPETIFDKELGLITELKKLVNEKNNS